MPTGSLKILVAHGVNLDLLGTREPSIYGSQGLAAIESSLRLLAPELARWLKIHEPEIECFQTNIEHEMLQKIAEPFDGILINPAAWTHTSLALADRLKGLAVPYVEVHISNTAAREPIRHHSFTAPAASGVVSGFGVDSYLVGLLGLLLKLRLQN